MSKRRTWQLRSGSKIVFGKQQKPEPVPVPVPRFPFLMTCLDDGTLVTTHDIAVHLYCQGLTTEPEMVKYVARKFADRILRGLN